MFGNLVLSSICREVFGRVNIDESARNPVRLYVDEFENLVGDSAQEFESILAEGRKYRLHLAAGHQTLAQLTPKLRSLILNNIGCKVVMRTGREDGAILSKDLTGDPKKINFSDLPVGEAMLWRRSQELVGVEINRPIVHGGGKRSAQAQKYIEQIHACHGNDTALLSGLQLARTTDKGGSTLKTHKPVASLEEWL